MSGVVIVGSVPPCTNYSGGIFLESIVRSQAVQIAGLVAIQIRALSPQVAPDIATAWPIRTFYKANEFVDPAEGLTSGEIRDREVRRVGEAAILAEQVLAFCASVKASQIWIVLEGQTLIRVAHALVRSGRYPVRVQVMDPPGWQLRETRVDADTVAEVLSLFEETLTGAAACAAASWDMARHYGERYGVPATAVVPSLPADLAQAPALRPPSATRKIGFAGQPYARDEFNAFLQAAAAEHHDPATGPVELHFFSSWSVEPPASFEQQLFQRGWLKQKSLIPALAEMDLLYCPYWFDETYREETRLCFPSKLTSYLAAGRPVLFHGRSDASPARFLRQGAGGFFCFRPDTDSLRGAITAALAEPDVALERARNGQALFQRDLTEVRLAEAIREFLKA